jgi:hypothetical protein
MKLESVIPTTSEDRRGRIQKSMQEELDPSDPSTSSSTVALYTQSIIGIPSVSQCEYRTFVICFCNKPRQAHLVFLARACEACAEDCASAVDARTTLSPRLSG